MPIDVDEMIRKIVAGEYSRDRLEALHKNALRKSGADAERVAAACAEELKESKPRRLSKTGITLSRNKTVWWLAIDSNNRHCSYQELKERKSVAQGWPKLGDLSEQLEFKYQMDKPQTYENIKRIGDKAYKGAEHWEKDRLPSGTPRVFWNLLNLRKGDLVVAIEGTTVRGVCELEHHGVDGYSFDPNYNYAHRFGGDVDWIDWDKKIFGEPPTPPRLSVKGISRLSNQAHYVIKSWESFSPTENE